MLNARSVVIAPWRVVLDSPDATAIPPGSVQIRVDECGLCGSDVKMFTGTHPTLRPPLILGHECVGVIVQVGEGVASVLPGQKVVCFPPIGCGDCAACAAGHAALCPSMNMIGGSLPGGLAQHLVLPATNAIPVPEEVPAHLAVLTEPLAVGVRAVSRAGDLTGKSCLVVGAGPIGIMVASVLRGARVAELLLIDTDRARVESAERLGIPAQLVAPAYVPRTASGYAVAFDCVGSRVATDVAVSAIRPGGTVVLVGVVPQGLHLDGPAVQRGERSIVGSMMYTRGQFVEALDLLAAGVLSADLLADGNLIRYVALGDVEAALNELGEHRFHGLKLVVRPGEQGAGHV
jgi:threonine dehydrogenase-like Zn-dependent dehydrogenase